MCTDPAITLPATIITQNRFVVSGYPSPPSRTGDPAAPLKKALRERDLGLDDDTRLDISTSLAEGDEVEVGVNPAGGSH